MWPNAISADRYCDIPDFGGLMPTSWLYVGVSICVFLLERTLRFVRSLRKHQIVKYHQHPSDVLEIMIENSQSKNKINYRAGQFVFLNVSEVSMLEWHPFTVTSSPSDKYLTGKFESSSRDFLDQSSFD